MLTALLIALQAETRLYHASLGTKGEPVLPFDFELVRKDDGAWTAFLLNGEERIEVPKVVVENSKLVLDMPHYDSRITAEFDAFMGEDLAGIWEKRRGAEEVARVPFTAKLHFGCGTADATPRVSEKAVAGRWAVRFETDPDPAVAEFTVLPEGKLQGTFLTATGDYRYLSGWQGNGYLKLSCFDGAHAFLFSAWLHPDGTLAGDFWSGNWHHETWTAKRDDSAHLDDPFAQTKWNGKTKLADLSFPDLDGTQRSLGDFAGKATLLVVFGSWCPNCNDEAKLLRTLDAKYRSRGLAILGLAFELTGEPARDAEQVRIFAQRHELAIPFFLCGTADKAEATQALGLLDRVRAFPSTIFVGSDGAPRAVHSGYAGPATGEEHQKLVREFEARIEALLLEAPSR